MRAKPIGYGNRLHSHPVSTCPRCNHLEPRTLIYHSTWDKSTQIALLYILSHAATCTMSSAAPARTPQERAFALMAERDLVDQQLQAHTSTLTSHGANMSTSLVDGQGFPRADLDLVAVRTARVRVIELTNDRIRITDEIARVLAEVFSANGDAPATPAPNINGISSTTEVSSSGTPEPPAQLLPFARVDGVAPGSPAQQAVSATCLAPKIKV